MKQPNQPSLIGVWISLVFGLIVVAFLPLLNAQFLNWDDQTNLVQNFSFRGWSARSLAWMFFSFRLGVWQPLSWGLFDLEWTLWGLDPLMYHLVSIVLHGINTALLFIFIRQFMSRVILPDSGDTVPFLSAAVAALFWGLHPLRVEPVGWLSAQPYLLAAAWSLLTGIFYLRHLESQKPSWLWGAVLFYGLALMSKGMVLTLPLALLVLDSVFLEKPWRSARFWIARLPFFILTGAAAWIALKGKSAGMETWSESGLFQRAVQGAYGLVFYGWKTLLPFGLSPLYPLPPHLGLSEPRFLLGVTAAVGLTAILWVQRKERPSLWAGWLAYGILLAPVLGLVQSGPQLVADRYSYLPGVVFSLWVGTGIRMVWSKGTQRYWLMAGMELGLLMLGIGSWHQSQVWRDSETLWRSALKRGGICPTALNNLGNTLLEKERFAEAVQLYEQSLRINPGQARAHNNLGLALLRTGKTAQAIAHFQMAINLDDRDTSAHLNLGHAFMELGRTDDALRCYREQTVIKPDQPDGFHSLGMAYLKKSCYAEAVAVFEKALDLDPHHLNALFTLAWIKATCSDAKFRRGSEALILARRLCELIRFENPQGYDALAAAYAELGQFPEAIQAAGRARELALWLQQERMAGEISRRIEQYRRDRPFRMSVSGE